MQRKAAQHIWILKQRITGDLRHHLRCEAHRDRKCSFTPFPKKKKKHYKMGLVWVDCNYKTSQWVQHCCIMQPSSDKLSQLRVDCVTLQSAVTARIVGVGGSWGALRVCLNTCAPVIWDRRDQECLGCVGTQACAWDNGVRPTLFWKPSFMADFRHPVLSSDMKKIKTWPISFPRREISTGI